MTGKEIAANLRANRSRWTRNLYHDNGKYCVLGLKLHELGVRVEDWTEHRQKMPVIYFQDFTGILALAELQKMNDRPESGLSDEVVFDGLLAYCDMNADKDYPLEAFADYLKAQEASRS